MKVVVLGGYGVFGGNVAQLLVRDGHDVVVAGRHAAKAEAFAACVGARSLCVDRAGDLDAIWAFVPDVVVDAAGPFHTYGTDPYRLPRACISQGVHYLDLADNPSFCMGVCALDAQAKAAGVFVLSGLSSVPAISSAAVSALSKDALQIDTISSAILPGNRAPRGQSVVHSILSQCGQTMQTPVDGALVDQRSWSGPQRFDLGQGIQRDGWVIAVPDHQLFATAFGARTVAFRAGLELGIMNYALVTFSWLRERVGFGVPAWLVRHTLITSKLFWPFGTDTGGMSVAVTQLAPSGWRQSTWRMVVRDAQGPFIPAVPVRCVLRQPELHRHGARPAVSEVTLA